MGPVDVYTAEEVARAVGVPISAVRALIASGDLRPLAAGARRHFAESDVVRVVRRLRDVAVIDAVAAIPSLFSRPSSIAPSQTSGRRPLVVSGFAHVLILFASVWLSWRTPHTVAAAALAEPARLVFLTVPGAGGGGGGSGEKRREPTRFERAGRDPVSVPVAAPVRPRIGREDATRREPDPNVAAPSAAPLEPLPATPLTAPLATTAAALSASDGVIEAETGSVPAGSGQGTGNGQGDGSGVGPGEGGGIGGGPYRAGSGIQPPRLLREVKADYTEEARRKGITGDVILEIVVRRDGRVGDVTVLTGLDPGLDQRAIVAVRQWQFSPARRQNQSVDVLVEVAVEFSLR